MTFLTALGLVVTREDFLEEDLPADAAPALFLALRLVVPLASRATAFFLAALLLIFLAAFFAALVGDGLFLDEPDLSLGAEGKATVPFFSLALVRSDLRPDSLNLGAALFLTMFSSF